MNDPDLTSLADAVTDGERIDWRAAGARVKSARAQALASQLRTLAEIGGSGDARTIADRTAPGGLPLLLRAVRALAGTIALAGAIGLIASAGGGGRSAIPLVIVAAFGGTGLLLAWGTRDRAAAALAGAYWCIAAAFAVSGTGTFFHAIAPVSVAAVLDALRPEAFLAAFFWQFAREFPSLTRFSRIERICRTAFRISVVLGSVLFAANVASALDLPALLTWTRPLDRMTGNGDGFWLMVFGATLPALLVIPLRAREATAGERRRTRRFLYGIACGLGPVTAEVLAEALVPSFGRLMRTPAGRMWGAWVVYPPILAVPLWTAYVVAVDDVLQLRVILRQGARHVLARWLITWGTVAALAALIAYLYAHRDQPLGNLLATRTALGLLAVTAVGTAATVFRPSLMRALDRWIVPDAVDPAASLAALTGTVRTCRTRIELASAFAGAAGRALQASAHVYVMSDPERLVATSGGAPGFPRDSLIEVLLRATSTCAIVEPGHAGSYYPLVTAADRQWIDAGCIGVVCPLCITGTANTLFAVVAVQSRRNGLSFSRDDLQFLETAAASVALAAGSLQSPSAAAAGVADEELACQCRACGRVTASPQPAAPCDCGGAWETAALPQSLFDRFTLTTFLGAGGMGIVYRATDRVLHRDVALKTLPALTAAAADQLIGEARTMAALCHAHIGVLYGTETWRQTPVLVMEYLAGGTLARRLQRGPLEIGAALRMTIALADALEHVHASGWYHGDIKPSNVGFTQAGAAKFLDFGLSRARADAASPLAGTIAYLSPDVLRGEPAGPALDLWALAVVLFESLAGVHPFIDGRRTTARIRAGLEVPLSRWCPAADSRLDSLIADALAADPARRPRDAAAFRHRLLEIEAAGPVRRG